MSPAPCCCRAEGRTLQAVKDPASPHRVANHNFGSWESWEVTSSGLVNLQWRHKVQAGSACDWTPAAVLGTGLLMLGGTA